MLSDLKYALRLLRRNPGFTVSVVLTLALGIGANTAIFRVINAVLLGTLPVKDPEQLVFLTNPDNHGFWLGRNSGNRDHLTYAEFQYLRDRNTDFSGMLAVNSFPQQLDVAVKNAGPLGTSGRVAVSMVSGNYFSVLGIHPVLGRTFGPDEDKVRDINPVAVISYQYWQNQLGGDPAAVGRQIRIRDTLYDIVGVAPPGFSGETVGFTPAIWAPLGMQAEIIPGRDWLSQEINPFNKTLWLEVIGRLKPGIDLVRAKTDINLAFQQYLQAQLDSGVSAHDKRDFLDQHIALVEGSHGGSTLRHGYGRPLVFLMALVGLLLLIACANVANLLLARATSRRAEIAIRVAVGSKPTRVFRQLLTESLLLSIVGGAAGFGLSRWGESALLGLVGQNLDLRPNLRILIFCVGISVLVGILFGMAPAWQAVRLDVNAALKGAIGGATKAGRLSLGRILVVAQVALSLLLLVVAGLFVHSFRRLEAVDLGFDHDHLLTFEVDPTTSGYSGPAIGRLYHKLSDRIGIIPGVRAVSFAVLGPFSGGDSNDRISIEGYTPTSGQEMATNFDQVGPNYFSTVGVPVVLGREIGSQDTAYRQRVGLLNQAMAHYYFGDANPIGRRIWSENLVNRVGFIVVGIVADAKHNSIRENPSRRYYVPADNPIFEVTAVNFEVRAAGNPSVLIAAIRAAVKESAPNLPPVAIQTMNRRIDQTLSLDHLLTKLSGFFGGLAAVLASIGIYGVMSYTVTRRTREIGIRMALGAQRGDVFWLILSESLLLMLIGIGIGVPAAIGAGKLIANLLFGLAPIDPIVLGVVAALIAAVAILAGYIPAWRATRVDPMVTLRME